MHTILLQGHSDTDMMLIVKLAEKMKIDVLPLSMNEIEEIEDLKLLRSMNNEQWQQPLTSKKYRNNSPLK